MLPDGAFSDFDDPRRRRGKPRVQYDLLHEQGALGPPEDILPPPNPRAGLFGDDADDVADAGSVAFAPVAHESAGALDDVKPPAPPKKKGRSIADNMRLIGATLTDVSGGLAGRGSYGALNDFLDREKGQHEKEEWEGALAGMNLDPTAMMFAKRNPNAFLAQTFGDQAEAKRYDRGRKDSLKDTTSSRKFDVSNREDTQAHADAAAEAARKQQKEEFYASLRLDKDKLSHSGGDAPSGYQWVRQPDGSMGLAFIKGGPADPETKNKTAEYDRQTSDKFIQKAQVLDSLDGALNQYLDLVRSKGPQFWTTGLQGDNPDAKQLEAANTNIKMQAKALFDLGVINGPDLQILNSAVPPVTGIDALGKSAQSVESQLQILRDYVARGREQIPEAFVAKARPNGAPSGMSTPKPGGFDISGIMKGAPDFIRKVFAPRGAAPAPAPAAPMQAQPGAAAPSAPQAAAPRPGTVEDGYQYVGGDPSNPNSWRRVQ